MRRFDLSLNNKGMTLVEIIVSLLILGIISLSFATAFASTARIMNRATLLKNASSCVSSSVELQSIVKPVNDDKVNVSFKDDPSEKFNSTSTATFKCYKYTRAKKTDSFPEATNTDANLVFTANMKGFYLIAKDSGTELSYKEFIPTAPVAGS